MKATELKLGDWVCFRNPETGKKKTVRITAIHGDRLVSFGMGKTALVDSLSPIPLTKEMLEKNGYEEGKGIDECAVSYSKDDLFLEYHWDENKIYFQDLYRSVNYKELQYVHEFQHILWALGMKDNIKI